MVVMPLRRRRAVLESVRCEPLRDARLRHTEGANGLITARCDPHNTPSELEFPAISVTAGVASEPAPGCGMLQHAETVVPVNRVVDRRPVAGGRRRLRV